MLKWSWNDTHRFLLSQEKRVSRKRIFRAFSSGILKVFVLSLSLWSFTLRQSSSSALSWMSKGYTPVAMSFSWVQSALVCPFLSYPQLLKPVRLLSLFLALLKSHQGLILNRKASNQFRMAVLNSRIYGFATHREEEQSWGTLIWPSSQINQLRLLAIQGLVRALLPLLSSDSMTVREDRLPSMVKTSKSSLCRTWETRSLSSSKNRSCSMRQSKATSCSVIWALQTPRSEQ